MRGELGDNNVIVCVVGSRNKTCIEAVRAFAARCAWCSVAHTVNAVFVDAPRAQKIRQPSSGGGMFRGEFSCSADRSPAHRPSRVKAPYRLQRQAAGSGFPGSLLMLGMSYTHQSLVVKCRAGYAIGVERPPAAYRQTPPLPFLNPQPNKSVTPRPGGGLSTEGNSPLASWKNQKERIKL